MIDCLVWSSLYAARFGFSATRRRRALKSSEAVANGVKVGVTNRTESRYRDRPSPTDSVSNIDHSHDPGDIPDETDEISDLEALFHEVEREAQALIGATPERAVYDLQRTLLDLLALTGGDPNSVDPTEPFLQ